MNTEPSDSINLGWIKLNRSIREHWIFEDAQKLKWWVTILLEVNHEAKTFTVGFEKFECKSGQSFNSINKWTELFGCSKKTTMKFLKMLDKEGMIIRKTLGNGNRRKHLLSLTNWSKYQRAETRMFLEGKPECSSKGNPKVPPNKNEKNEKNEKKTHTGEFSSILNHYYSECNDMPKITALTESRKKIIKARIKEYGLETVKNVISKAGKSDFLSGRTENPFVAGFDWIFKPSNFIKILEGNYDKKMPQKATLGVDSANGERREAVSRVTLDSLRRQGFKVFPQQKN